VPAIGFFINFSVIGKAFGCPTKGARAAWAAWTAAFPAAEPPLEVVLEVFDGWLPELLPQAAAAKAVMTRRAAMPIARMFSCGCIGSSLGLSEC
jgi:hypothetical protein